MSLVNCYECAAQINTRHGTMCPLCGAPHKKKAGLPALVWAAALVVGCPVVFVSFKAAQEALRTPQERAQIEQKKRIEAYAMERMREKYGADEGAIEAQKEKKNKARETAILVEMQKKRAAMDEIKQVVKDPSSLQFRNQRGSCGEVNSKNSFGAYTGFQRYMAVPGLAVFERDSAMAPGEFSKAWNKACR
jgi:hypothetical protein